MIVKEKNILNYTALGVFFLIWSTQAFILAGDIAKYGSLFFGIFFLVASSFKRKFLAREIKFFTICFLFLLGYLFIASIQKQDTLDRLQLSFTFINFILLCVGYSMGLKSNLIFKISNKIIFIITFLSIIGSIKFIQHQTLSSIGSDFKRNNYDNFLNPIGIAYLHSLLTLFLFWLFKNTQKRTLRYLLILAMFLTLFVVILTMSRGAILYLAIIFILYKFRTGLKFNLKLFFKPLISVLLFFVIIFFVVKNTPSLYAKLDHLIERFSLLFNFFTESQADLSALNRTEYYYDFFNNLNEFIFLGKYEYHPYPHNQFLEIIMRWGFFGFPLLIFSINNLFRSIKLFNKKILNQNQLLFLILPLFLFSYLQSMSSMSLEMNRTLWLGFGFMSSFVTMNSKVVREA
tara:strand:- start:7328 stop:8536 length:1209 start_codon:yes stop_codon:yes gene_type:complete